MSDCFTCANTAAGATAPRRERIVITDHWRVAHAFGTTLPGWLVVVPTVHVESLTDLPAGAAAELGPLLQTLSAALRDVVGCVKTYVALFAEAEGFAHLHFHVIPRMPDQPAQLRGPGVFAALGRERAVPATAMDELAESLAAHLASVRDA